MDTATGELKNHLTGHNRFVVSVAYSPDGSTIASGSGDQTVRLWDATTGTLKNTLTGHSSTVYSVAYSPDGNTVASVSYDNTPCGYGTQRRANSKTHSPDTSGVFIV